MVGMFRVSTSHHNQHLAAKGCWTFASRLGMGLIAGEGGEGGEWKHHIWPRVTLYNLGCPLAKDAIVTTRVVMFLGSGIPT